jgi:hypothetical protein
MIEGCPSPRSDCPYYDRRPRGPLKGKQFHGCFSDTDHHYWPENQYTTRLEKEFRNLPENKEQICRDLHDERHEFEHPPKKPSVEDMIRAIAQSALEGGQSEEQAA